MSLLEDGTAPLGDILSSDIIFDILRELSLNSIIIFLTTCKITYRRLKGLLSALNASRLKAIRDVRLIIITQRLTTHFINEYRIIPSCYSGGAAGTLLVSTDICSMCDNIIREKFNMITIPREFAKIFTILHEKSSITHATYITSGLCDNCRICVYYPNQ